MCEYYDYERHLIEVDLIEIVPARYRWLYMIDRERFGRSSDDLQDLETARAQALSSARLEIDGHAAERETAAPEPSIVNHGPRHANRVALTDAGEARYWMNQFGVDEFALQGAVARAGDEASDVEAELLRRGPHHFERADPR